MFSNLESSQGLERPRRPSKRSWPWSRGRSRPSRRSSQRPDKVSILLVVWKFVDVSRLGVLLILLVCDASLEKELGELKDATQYVMDLYVPQEEGAEPKPLIDRLDEVEGRIKGLLLDTANLAVAVALLTVKYHDPSFDLQKVSEDVDLSGLVTCEDVVAAAEEVVKKFDFSTD
jgi:hypothetical protein